MSSDNRIIIFDTTLRDGEQALPQSLSARQKLQIALALEELGVDVLEAGFPISSKGDFESVSQIAATLKKTIPCGLSRCVAKDIEAAGEALRVAERFRIHTFIATSTIHVRDKLRKSFDDIVEMAKASVKLARNYTDDVEFSCEDAGRTPIDELCRMVEAAMMRAPRPSTFPIPRATHFRRNSAALSPTSSTVFPTSTKLCSQFTATTTWAWQRPIR